MEMTTDCKMNCGKIMVLAVFGIAVLGWVVMALWNWLVPALFSGKEIAYLQAMGLLLLSKILFGHWGGRHCPSRHLHRWHGMTPEEREKFREGMRGCYSKKEDGENK
jgi:hypothetical protein